MEELKILVGMVADLPDLAIAVILAFFAYKMFIVGSIYGVIKLTVQRLHDAIVFKKTVFVEVEKEKIVEKKIPVDKIVEKKFIYNTGGDRRFISEEVSESLNELCAEMATFSGTAHGYLHESDVQKAIGILRENKVKAAKGQ